ncbi:MAG TPA: NlpC/P60 family protein [Gaiellales bacterium]|jgi:cell wall-associated NlpC family hydrolase|nr:NlpC/P60 family protein [Gaiellales bacterium]
MCVGVHARAGGVRATRASILVLTLTAAALAASATQSVAASSISAKRAEARQVESEIMTQQAALEKQIEKYNAIHQHYLDTRHALENNRIVLSVARHNLLRAQQALAQSLTSTYKSSGEDVVSYLLAAHSFSELVDHVQAVQRENNTNGDLIKQINATKALIAKRTAVLKTQTAQLAADQAAQARERQRVESGLHALEARKARISADIQHLIDQQQAREQAAATAAAASSSGGGGGGNIPVPPSSTLGGQAVAIAEQYLGVPYVWGGASPSGFDCSGLTMYVYGQLGVSLPHNAAAQYGMGTPVPRDALEPGDLVFFDGLGHVGIYVGGGSFIHAPHTGTVVQISSMSGWYSDNYVGARRIG